jgi:uncharacterized protein YlzI (FlbEa/FlbD family)
MDSRRFATRRPHARFRPLKVSNVFEEFSQERRLHPRGLVCTGTADRHTGGFHLKRIDLCEPAATKVMIQLTRLNKHPIGVNSDLIKFIENAPDTMITLLTGEKILVLESFNEILERIVAFRQRVLSGLDIMDYIANAKGPEIARLPGVNKSSVGVYQPEAGTKGAEGAAELEKPREPR